MTLQGVKKLETHGKQFPGQNFVFTLSKVGEDGNRNQVDVKWVWFGTADSQEEIRFNALTFTQQDYINQPAGGYEFVVTEKNLANDPSQSNQHKPGTSYDSNEYHFFVKLTQNVKTGELTAKVCDQNGTPYRRSLRRSITQAELKGLRSPTPSRKRQSLPSTKSGSKRKTTRRFAPKRSRSNSSPMENRAELLS